MKLLGITCVEDKILEIPKSPSCGGPHEQVSARKVAVVARKTKHLDIVDPIQKDICCLEVSMEQVLFVAIGERGSQLPEMPGDCCLGQRAILMSTGLYERPQITPRRPLHLDSLTADDKWSDRSCARRMLRSESANHCIRDFAVSPQRLRHARVHAERRCGGVGS